MKFVPLTFLATFLAGAFALSSSAASETFVIDTDRSHASITFRIKHLGFSWLTGRFDDFNGTFTFDAKKPENSTVKVEIDTKSVNTNHAERDKHLRGKDFLNVSKYPTATFESTGVKLNGDAATITGKLTLHGVTKEIEIAAKPVGGGEDPWGGYRQGFTAITQLALKDFGIDYDLGPASQVVDMTLDIEGIRQ
jgi:polyisoprenoid-binding protein YceI